MSPVVSRRHFTAAAGAGAAGMAMSRFDAIGNSVGPSPPPAEELCELTAVELATRLARKELSAREVMSAHLAQIERINPRVNAIVTLVAEQAMAGAARADEAIMRRAAIGV